MKRLRRLVMAGVLSVGVMMARGQDLGRPHDDAALVRLLLEERLDRRRFRFPVVMEAATGRKVIPYAESSASHTRVREGVSRAIRGAIAHLSREDSPVRKLRRINEASRFFEDELRTRLDGIPGLRCSIPETEAGQAQRSGYPDLRIVDEATGDVFYLDPKLVERGSEESTLRTFYFEPRERTSKIHDDAVHLLLGILHDGRDGAWTFDGWKLVDLSTVSLRLKAEFQASNSDVYQKSLLSSPARSNLGSSP